VRELKLDQTLDLIAGGWIRAGKVAQHLAVIHHPVQRIDVVLGKWAQRQLRGRKGWDGRFG